MNHLTSLTREYCVMMYDSQCVVEQVLVREVNRRTYPEGRITEQVSRSDGSDPCSSRTLDVVGGSDVVSCV